MDNIEIEPLLLPTIFPSKVLMPHGLMELGQQLLAKSKQGDLEAVKSLIAQGAPFTADWVGTSPIHWAVHINHIDITKALLKAGITRDARNKVDRTPLHIAAQNGFSAMIKLLLVHGADVNCKDMLKMTPLHWAAESGDVPSVQTLLSYNCDTTVINKFGKTAIMIARENNHLDIAHLIKTAAIEDPAKRQALVDMIVQNSVFSKNKKKTSEVIKDSISSSTSSASITKSGTTTKKKLLGVLFTKPDPETGIQSTLELVRDSDSPDELENEESNAAPVSCHSIGPDNEIFTTPIKNGTMTLSVSNNPIELVPPRKELGPKSLNGTVSLNRNLRNASLISVTSNSFEIVQPQPNVITKTANGTTFSAPSINDTPLTLPVSKCSNELLQCLGDSLRDSTCTTTLPSMKSSELVTLTLSNTETDQPSQRESDCSSTESTPKNGFITFSEANTWTDVLKSSGSLLPTCSSKESISLKSPSLESPPKKIIKIKADQLISMTKEKKFIITGAKPLFRLSNGKSFTPETKEALELKVTKKLEEAQKEVETLKKQLEEKEKEVDKYKRQLDALSRLGKS